MEMRLSSKAVATAALTLGVLMLLTGSDTARANPPGAPQGQLAFKFNYIAAPDLKNGNFSCGDGHRIFTLLGARSQHIDWEFDPTQPINIDDCLTEAMDGTSAHIFADAQGTYTIWVRILGPVKDFNTLSICRSVDTDFTLCELGSVNLDRKGLDRFTFPTKLFDTDKFNEFWELVQGSNFRIAEIRLYQ